MTQAAASPNPILATKTAVSIHRHDQNFDFGEGVIDLRMVDEGGGVFFELRQEDRGPIRADLEDLVAIVLVAQKLHKQPGAGLS
jgi:hypothetical protein